MSQLNFSDEAQGYSKSEVDSYINMLQNEYMNAVEWSNEIERQFEEYKSSNQETEKLRKENVKLLSDCKLLAARLRSLNECREENAVSDLNSYEEKADLIVKEAEQRADDIIQSAYKSQEQIISKISSEIIQTQNKISNLTKEKATLSAEIDALLETKKNIEEKIMKAKEILNF